MDVIVLSQIQMIATDRILPFEWPGSDVFGGDGSLSWNDLDLIRHPFPVASLTDGNYLLLEETDEFRAHTEGGLDVLPVQVCSLESLKTKTDRLGLVNFTYDDLLRLAGKSPEQIFVRESGEKQPAGAAHVEVGFSFKGRPPVSVWLRHSSKAGCPGPLAQIFRVILQQGRYIPITHIADRPDALTRNIPVSATITLPSFTLNDLMSAASADRLFPPGIIRVAPGCRVLNIDLPVSVLKSDVPIEDKELYLRELIVLREQWRRTSFYEGQVYLLNR